MLGISPFEILWANFVVAIGSGVLPALAIVVMGVLILRRLPARRADHASSAARGSSAERADEQRPVSTPQR